MTENHKCFALFGSRRFLPLFITQFSGAFNDNFLKGVIVALVTFVAASTPGRAGMLTNLAMALFMLPYFLFSSMAGQWADHTDKSRCCRIVKIVEVVLMVLTAFTLYFQVISALMILLFFMGTQSTFFGPVKYALLPQHLRDEELLGGNALIEGGTFLSILSGTIAGSIIVVLPGGMTWAGIILVVFAVTGYLASCLIPPAPPDPAAGAFVKNPLTDTVNLIRESLAMPVAGPCILALSVFWMAGALYASLLPVLCLGILCGNELVNTFLLALFSIGVAAGAVASGWILRGKVSGRLSFWSMTGMAAGSFLLAWECRSLAPETAELLGLKKLCCEPFFWRITLEMLAVSFFGGMFSVPLQALMQHAAPASKVARVIAANNVVNAVYMAGATVLAALASFLWEPPPGAVIGILGMILLFNAWYCRKFR